MNAITREEKIMSGENLTPITRKEMFLAKAAGMDVETPEPITREEIFLSKIQGGNGGSGGATINNQDKTITENGVYQADAGYTGLGTVTVEVTSTGGGGSTGGVHKSTIGGLKLFDAVKFGRWDGHELYWFVSDTDYEGHTILTVMPSSHLKFSMCGVIDSSIIENEGFESIYRLSDLRQFLNAESADWFSEKYVGNTPPEYSSKFGFLYNFTEKEKEIIEPMEIKAVEYLGLQPTDYIVNTYTDKVWIPSKKQCGGNAGTAEGSKAFAASLLITNIFWEQINPIKDFYYTRTQNGQQQGYVTTGTGVGYYSRDITQKPISIVLKRTTEVCGYQASKDGLYLWEVSV